MNYTHGSLENEILKTVWNIEDSEERDVSVTEVQETINNNSKNNRAYTTVKTVMDRLVEKNMLVRYKQGKKFFYKAAMDRHEMAAESVKDLCGRFFNGSYTEMIRFIERECSEFLVG